MSNDSWAPALFVATGRAPCLAEAVGDRCDEVLGALAKQGAICWRGFAPDTAAFEAASQVIGTDFITNGAPDRVSIGNDGGTQTVTSGKGLIPPHAELSFSPFRPDLVWLHCWRAARRGGATFLVDGRALWRSFDEATRRRYLDHPLRYTLDVKLPWLASVGQDHADPAAAAEAIGALSGVVGIERAAESLSIIYECSAVVAARTTGDACFTNSILVEPTRLTIDGAPVPHHERVSLLEASRPSVYRHRWRDGDVLVLDNSRVMHGRAAFTDPDREVFVRLSAVAS